MKTIVFRRPRQRDLLKWGVFFVLFGTACLWPVLWPTESISFGERCLLVPCILFFWGAGGVLLKAFFRPEKILELRPEGLRGRANLPQARCIAWQAVRAVKLEWMHGQPVIGVQTDWPVPMWKALNSAQRRMLWKRYHRRQSLLLFYIEGAAAPPEAILHTIQEELTRARERMQMSAVPEEGGTPLC